MSRAGRWTAASPRLRRGRRHRPALSCDTSETGELGAGTGALDDRCTFPLESREDDRRQFRKERPEGTFSGLHPLGRVGVPCPYLRSLGATP
jgi:hypothetical protein